VSKISRYHRAEGRWDYVANAYEIQIDRSKSLLDDPRSGHNRWHSDISPILTVNSGDIVRIQTRDALDGAVTRASTSDDISRLNLKRVHPLTGPIFITDAQPGDILEVAILEVACEPFGYTFLLPGSGLLREYFPLPYLVGWDIRDGYATSAELPGVRIPGDPFMGVMGVTPSDSLLQEITDHEREAHHQGAKVLLPIKDSAVPQTHPIAFEGLRTAPPRANGGNLDIKQLTKGSKIFFPVFKEGALFSAGDAHFAQGDGESCGTAIETAATLTASFKVHKQNTLAIPRYGLRFECLMGASATESEGRRYCSTVGISVHSDGRLEPGNLMLAAENALLAMIDHLNSGYGLTREQSYILASVAADLRISQLVNRPNVGVSAFLPLDIFNQ
jgi:formamidase